MTDFDYGLANHAIRITSDRSDCVFLWFWPQMTAIRDRIIAAAKQDMWETRREPRGQVFCGARQGKQYDLSMDQLRTWKGLVRAYSTGIARIIEPLLPLVIGRPPRIPAGIPAGDRFSGSGSKRDAVGHCASLRCSSRRFRKFQRWFVADLRVGAKNDTGAP
jgi:hypothetical protein